MVIDIPANIETEIERYAREKALTHDEAVVRLLETGLRASAGSEKTPAERMIGLFSSPEDAELMDEVVEIAYEGRRQSTTRDIGL